MEYSKGLFFWERRSAGVCVCRELEPSPAAQTPWHIARIPTLLRQRDYEFEASLGDTARLLGGKKAELKTGQLRALAVPERTPCGSQPPVPPAPGDPVLSSGL